jgi:hypothetical protein
MLPTELTNQYLGLGASDYYSGGHSSGGGFTDGNTSGNYDNPGDKTAKSPVRTWTPPIRQIRFVLKRIPKGNPDHAMPNIVYF